jgi:hypothetical protein
VSTTIPNESLPRRAARPRSDRRAAARGAHAAAAGLAPQALRTLAVLVAGPPVAAVDVPESASVRRVSQPQDALERAGR